MSTSDNAGRHRRGLGTSGTPGSGRGFEHAALFYDDEAQFVTGVVDHVREGLEVEDAVVIALPGEHLGPLRDALGGDAGAVVLQDVRRLGPNPARLVPALHRFMDEHPDRRVRAVGGGLWPDRPAEERAAYLQHDALTNVAFADRPVTMLCPYDTRSLDPDVLADVRAAHPLLVEGGAPVTNVTYADPAKLAETVLGPLPEPPDLGETLVYTAPHGPRAVRRAVADHAAGAGLSADRVADLCLAVHEVAVNTIVHTEGPGILSLWHTDDRVVAEIQDSGHVADPLAGRHPPEDADGRGYGLFLTHRLCDLVRLHSSEDGGTTVRMTMYLDGRPR
ncbi:anti-sigma regulatory factor (Ser/Thr protein kinase) [Actinomycetospora succinea]|uniref:Anti-sigma regulatory factor (Ser/Thr protein kinase) n=1 Tax=Actinomycetospora succinea TaxID=663603 RepID=A0A4V3D7H7_9PSEU|nr:sensor histidine kinase [Actinomycetospora succinea]TDQ47937.1 anti-sigma regulatory factor (Ser/Thr protein kinase) [Actinomycetospora succinea]